MLWLRFGKVLAQKDTFCVGVGAHRNPKRKEYSGITLVRWLLLEKTITKKAKRNL